MDKDNLFKIIGQFYVDLQHAQKIIEQYQALIQKQEGTIKQLQQAPKDVVAKEK